MPSPLLALLLTLICAGWGVCTTHPNLKLTEKARTSSQEYTRANLDAFVRLRQNTGLLHPRCDAAVADFQAMAQVNAEDEISVSISDGAGRTVASGVIEQDGTPITWSTVQHDTVVAVAGFGDTLGTASIDALDHINKSRTDGAGRTIEAEDAEGEISTATYDANSNTLSTRDPNGVGMDCKYDERNRDVECTDTQGDTNKTEYDKNNLVVKQVDAKLNEVTCKFDARSRQFECTDRISSVTKWRFDQNSNLLSLEDGENQKTLYEYDVRNLQVKTTWPDHVAGQNPGDADYGITECTFDAARRKVRLTDQKGDTQTNVWDLANRLEQRDYRLRINSPAGLISDTNDYDYDDASRPVQGVSGRYTNTCDLAYDNAGRPTSESLTVLAQTYTIGSAYDAANRKTGITYPDGTVVNREYTDRNQLEFVKYTNTAVGGTLTTFTVDDRAYDPGMRLETINSGNGIVTTKTYRNDNLTNSITRTGLSGADFTYTYDANKNKTSETISAVMQPFGFATTSYDDEDRLTAWNRFDGNKNQSFGLSLVGDWNNFTETGATPFSESRTHGATHELTNITGGPNAGPLAYDAKGNITTNSNTQSYAWDFDNQLSTVVVPAGAPGIAGTHSYTYDAFGRRVTKTIGGASPQTLVFINTGQQTIAEYLGGTVSATAERKYIYASYIDEPVVFIDRTALGAQTAGVEELFYYHTNNLYSVTALTDANGTVQERYAYDAYGNILFLNAVGMPLNTQASTITQRYTYTGRRLDDETGNYFYRARYFDAALGRFIGRDKINYVDGLNLYAYVNNRPTNSADPLGLEEKKFSKDISVGELKSQYFSGLSSDTDTDIIHNQIKRGCIGITCALLGKTALEDRENLANAAPETDWCYAKLEEALKVAAMWERDNHCCDADRSKKNIFGDPARPRVFNVQFNGRYWSQLEIVKGPKKGQMKDVLLDLDLEKMKIDAGKYAEAGTRYSIPTMAILKTNRDDPFFAGIPYDFPILIDKDKKHFLHADFTIAIGGTPKVSNLKKLEAQNEATGYFRHMFFCVACERSHK